jgi:tRNA 2-thiocytidine biosynthesis protein TtcA
MAHALGNVRPTHLLDRELQEAWAARPESIRPKAPTLRKEPHHRALPLLSGTGVVAEDDLR